MDKLGRQSVYVKDGALFVAIKHLCADMDATLIKLVDVALRHLIAMARAAHREGEQLDLRDLEALLEAAEIAFGYRAAAGKHEKGPVRPSL